MKKPPDREAMMEAMEALEIYYYERGDDMKTENGEFTEFDKGIMPRKCIMNAAAHSVGIDENLFEQFFLEYMKRLEQAQREYLVLDIK